MISDVADQLDQAVYNTHWAREGLEELGRDDLAKTLNEAMMALKVVYEEILRSRRA